MTKKVMADKTFIIYSPNFLSENKFNLNESNFNYTLNIGDQKLIEGKECKFLIVGNVIAKNAYFNELMHYTQEELVMHLYHLYASEFINYIKGNFIILIVKKNSVEVYNDHHAIRKFYYYIDNKFWAVSNCFKSLNFLLKPKFNPLFPAIQALFQHPVCGITISEKVFYSENATVFSANENETKVSNYWLPETLIKSQDKKVSLNELVNTFNLSIANVLKYFPSDNISATLTGGRDTRSVLACLLYNKKQPNLFTFGYPQGRDVIISKLVSSKLKLPFSNHNINKLDKNTYGALVKTIIEIGNPFIHLHRAHRLDAIIKETSKQKINLLFMGCMGGDYTKGVSFNDYIVTEFMRVYFFDSTITLREKIINCLKKNYIKYNDELIQKLEELINSLDFLKVDDFKKSEFYLAFKFIGSLHDVQDINIFQQYSNEVINPFMDIEFLDKLFRSEYSLLSNQRNSKNIFKKLKGGELQASIIKTHSYQLSNIALANHYKPKDILGNRLLYVVKRLFYKLTKKKNNPTFSYDAWFNDYLKEQIQNNSESEILDYYNTSKLKLDLNNNEHKSNEGYWHKFSNPVNLLLYYNYLTTK